ncbi:unnamed protein product [Phyllotreta striolata]|uniref:Uncharacterized protein n=1 Tax=Phyllotreta striolata TaxID=444603 RepID=A0A9N9XQ13_PHYSR|nr:unnamed protein product [Phyllotreta striolata]
MRALSVITFLVLTQSNQLGLVRAETPIKVEAKPLLLESYIPPAMQILAYLTEMMKYDLRPTTTPPYGPTTTSTMRPTPYHRPGIYAPLKPPGPEAYQPAQRSDSYKAFVESLKQPSGADYFQRYKLGQRASKSIQNPAGGDDNDDILDRVAAYFGRNFADTLRLVKEVDKDVPNNIDEQSQEFLKRYDDSNFKSELLRQKQIPPTRAYVSLLSLYDTLNQESKRQGLNKYTGYTEQMLKELADISSDTSAYQLRIVLKRIIDRRDTPRQEITSKIQRLINDLDDFNGYLISALKYIPPLAFSL